MLFAISYIVKRSKEWGEYDVDVVHVVTYGEFENEHIAFSKTHQKAETTYPRKEGWYDHSILVVDIPTRNLK